MLRVSLEQWRAFVATSELGSFQKAGQKLHKTQSAIGHSIRKMEASLGQRLFELDGRQARITQLGRVLLPHARDLIDEARQAEELCQLARLECQCGAREVPISVNALFPVDVLLSAIRALSRLYPSLPIRIHETASADAATLLTEGLVRIAITDHLPESAMAEPLMSVPFVCVAAPGHPLVRRRSISLSDLREYVNVVVEDAPVHRIEASGQKRWTISHVAGSLSFLRNSDGYAWLPEHIVKRDLESGSLVVLPVEPEQNQTLTFSLGYRQNDDDCGVILEFVSILREGIAGWRGTRERRRVSCDGCPST